MDSLRLVVVTGKGGVGRSAVAAAIALRAVRAGRRTLAISMTESGGLGEHLGVETLGPNAHEIRSGLSALQVERPAALDEYLRLQVGIPKFARLGPLASAFDALASAAPGIREIVTMGKVLYEVRRGDTWDLVVADGPPIGQIGSHLRAPRTVSDLVPTGRIRDQAAWMADILADPARSALVLVTLAEELPALETAEAMIWLQNSKLITTKSVITNRVLEPMGVPVSTGPSQGAVHEAAVLHHGLVEEQTKWLKQTPDGPRLPYLFGVTGPAEVAERLADLLGSL
ncbi:MAG: ArsA-related P-loop ATPase [Acidimicrobiia bacterium]|nr:ArsA-related P-loop ATPase [Acidimicrobiia bacterium]